MTTDETVSIQLTRIADALAALAITPTAETSSEPDVYAQIEAARLRGEQVYAERKQQARARRRARNMTTHQVGDLAAQLAKSGRPDLAARLTRRVS